MLWAVSIHLLLLYGGSELGLLLQQIQSYPKNRPSVQPPNRPRSIFRSQKMFNGKAMAKFLGNDMIKLLAHLFTFSFQQRDLFSAPILLPPVSEYIYRCFFIFHEIGDIGRDDCSSAIQPYHCIIKPPILPSVLPVLRWPYPKHCR